MIKAVHTLIYSDDAPATRDFLRDVLGWPFVEETSAGEGWLIFNTGPSELGVHPTVSQHGDHTHETTRHHEISFVCDDLEATRAELEAKGATFDGPTVDRGFGLTAMLQVPGADPILIYQPFGETAYDA